MQLKVYLKIIFLKIKIGQNRRRIKMENMIKFGVQFI